MGNPFTSSRFAVKEDFCRRPDLETKIESIIKSKGRLAVIGDRRLGKSSLVKEVARRSKIAHAYTDFMGVKTEADIAKRLMLLIKEPPLTNLLRTVSPNITWDNLTGSFQGNIFGPKARQLLSIDEILASIVKATTQGRISIIMDEFQDLAELDKDLSKYILGSFRREIQSMESAVIFIGSIRHKMTEIFTSLESPFFKSSEILTVPEIPEWDFFEFIKPRFKKGGIKIEPDVFDFIYKITRGVTGDIITLCNGVFDRCANDVTLLTTEHVKNALEALIWGNESSYHFYTKNLTSKQIDCLLAIIQHGGHQPYRTEVMRTANLTSATMTRSLDALVSKGVLFVSDDEYKFFDPFFAYWLNLKF